MVGNRGYRICQTTVIMAGCPRRLDRLVTTPVSRNKTCYSVVARLFVQ